MKPRSAIVPVLVLSVLMVNSVAAQQIAARWSFVPEVGVAIPVGGFGKSDEDGGAFARTGVSVGGSLDYFLSQTFAIGGTLSYSRFGFDTQEIAELEPSINWDAHWGLVKVGLHGKYVMARVGATRAYVCGGLVHGAPKGTVTGSSGGVSADVTTEVESALGVELGIGLMHFRRSTTALVAEILFSQLMTDGKEVVIAGVGTRQTGEADFQTGWVSIRIGGAFFFGK